MTLVKQSVDLRRKKRGVVGKSLKTLSLDFKYFKGDQKNDGWLDWGNRFLTLLAVGIIIYAIAGVFLNRLGDEGSLVRTSEANQDGEMLQEKKWEFPQVQSFDHYAKNIQQHNIFQLPWEMPMDENIDMSTSLQLSQQLTLMGVFLDGDPKIIIEDSATQQIHFVATGESIGNAVLQEIEADKAIFIYNGKKVELVL